MTDLQTSLMAIGGAFLVGVIGYNKWQEYKAKKSLERAFASPGEDVLMGQGDAAPAAERREPTIGADLPDQLAALAPSPDLPEDALPDTTARVPSEHKELPLDEVIDCAVPIALGAPVRGEKVIAQIQALRHVGSKPVHFIGQAEDGAWEAVGHGALYVALKAGVQLANRHAPLNEIEYSEFIMKLRQIADHLDAEPAVPDMAAVMRAARQLHQFVTDHDAQLGVNVVSGGAPWAVGTLMTALERQGFELRPDGRTVMPDGEGGVLFSLSTNVTLAAEATSRLTLLLDVPRVAPARDGFAAMTACARMLAARLNGNVVDDGNQPLSSAALTEISQQVAAFYAEMQSADIPAGSTRALRLFS